MEEMKKDLIIAPASTEKITVDAVKQDVPKKITKRIAKPKVETKAEPVITEEEKTINEAHAVKARIKELERKAKELDMRPVTGVFKNFQSPKIITIFSKRKYADEPITTYKLRDGEITTVPYYVAQELRQGCYYKRNARYQGTDGVEEVKVSDFIKVMDFFPHTEFIPGIEIEKGLIQVQMRK